jgi:hypothetical protein
MQKATPASESVRIRNFRGVIVTYPSPKDFGIDTVLPTLMM